jgi:hypothetical protein
VLLDVKLDAQKHITRSHVCSIASIVVPNACVCLQELMETRKFVHAITIGRPKKVDPNVLENLNCFHQIAHHVLYHYKSSILVMFVSSFLFFHKK